MTYKELQEKIKAYREAGHETIKLNSSKADLEAELARLESLDKETEEVQEVQKKKEVKAPTWAELKAVATKIAEHMEDLASKPVEEVLEIRRKVLQDAGVGQSEIEVEISSLRDRLNSEEVETEEPEQKVALTPQQLEQLQQDLNEIGAELADRLLEAMTATDTALSAAKQLAERSSDSLYEAAKQQAISQLPLVEQRHLSRLNRANLSLPFFAKALKGVKPPQSFDEINELAPVYLELIRQHLEDWQVFSTTRWES